MVASACQWFGVAMMTPSMSLSSITRRRSCWNPGLNVATSARRLSLMRSSARFASMSHNVLISTFFSRAKPRLSELPWPRIPILASTRQSLAPITRPPTSGAADVDRGRRASVDSTAAAMVPSPSLDANARRVISLCSFGSLATITSRGVQITGCRAHSTAGTTDTLQSRTSD